MEDMIIQMALAIVLSTIKDPAKKARMKKAMLKVHQSILQAYAGDPDFQSQEPSA